MRISETIGRKIVSTSSAETVGTVDNLIVDPKRHSVVAVQVKKAASGGDALPWNEITAFGVDAVTVTSSGAVSESDEDVAALMSKDHRLIGKRVLSAAGDELGTLVDVDFDPEAGSVRALLLDTAEVAGDRLVGVGSYAVVVTPT